MESACFRGACSDEVPSACAYVLLQARVISGFAPLFHIFLHPSSVFSSLQAGDGAAAVPLLSVAYETLSHLELPEAEAEDGVAQVEGGQLAAEVQGLGAQVMMGCGRWWKWWWGCWCW